MTPQFPIRAIFDDGECIELEDPDALLERFHDLDSADGRVWVRDALDRTVSVRVRSGAVEVLQLRLP
ncbi:MAG TPA: hypothetical protein VGR02_06940 [Thermoanaerobaculia bacterium]|jgi:hypothetical protein|nr:hypothetical protein [Thermoanaerobaculia bacterium]